MSQEHVTATRAKSQHVLTTKCSSFSSGGGGGGGGGTPINFG